MNSISVRETALVLALFLVGLAAGEARGRLAVTVDHPGLEGREGQAIAAHAGRLASLVLSERFRSARGPLRLRVGPSKKDLTVELRGRDLRPHREDLIPLAGLEARLRLVGARKGLAEGRLGGRAVVLEGLTLHVTPFALVGEGEEGELDLRDCGLVAPGESFVLRRWKRRRGGQELAVLPREGLPHDLHLGSRTGKVINRRSESLLAFRALMPSILPHRILEGLGRLEALPGGGVGLRILLVAVDGAPMGDRHRLLLEEAFLRRFAAMVRSWEEEGSCRFWCESLRVVGREVELAGPALVNVDGELWKAGAAVRLERRPPGMGINPYR